MSPGGETRIGGMSSRAAGALLVVVMAIMAFSLWTVIPFGWIWIGSRVSNTQAPSTGPYAITFFGIVASILAVVWLLAWLNRLYVRVMGTADISASRVRLWRSLSEERAPSKRRWTVMEAVLLGSVITAVFAMLLWFAFIAGSPLPSQ